jgi:hypothetical protein
MAVLQATGGKRSGRAGAPESALLALFSDGGGVLEVVRNPKEGKYILLHHDIAEVQLLESYDRLPSLPQIARLFAQPAQIRARLQLRPDGSTDVELPGAEGKGGD